MDGVDLEAILQGHERTRTWEMFWKIQHARLFERAEWWDGLAWGLVLLLAAFGAAVLVTRAAQVVWRVLGRASVSCSPGRPPEASSDC